jgi:hypothetical protein
MALDRSNLSGQGNILSLNNQFSKMKRMIWIVVALCALLSCEKEGADAELLGENTGVVGTWVEEEYVEDLRRLRRSSDLDPASYGFSIRENGEFIERKNAGWCGTPPITYANFEGTWEALSDSLLDITVGYWGGMMTYQIRIVSLDHEKLAIRYLYAEDRASTK